MSLKASVWAVWMAGLWSSVAITIVPIMPSRSLLTVQRRIIALQVLLFSQNPTPCSGLLQLFLKLGVTKDHHPWHSWSLTFRLTKRKDLQSEIFNQAFG